MAVKTLDLWTLTRGRPQIDPNDLAEAIAVQAAETDLDYRTRLLIRDSVEALKKHWGQMKWQEWLAGCAHKDKVEVICRDEFDKVGFPSLGRRLMEKTDPDLIRKFLDHLGRTLRQETRIYVAGSGALILPGFSCASYRRHSCRGRGAQGDSGQSSTSGRTRGILRLACRTRAVALFSVRLAEARSIFRLVRTAYRVCRGCLRCVPKQIVQRPR